MSDSSFDDPTRAGVPGNPSVRHPERIGHYSIRRVIASGGMGTVYEATQEEPRRVVAVKVMRAGMESAEALHRFQFEAQLLARLQHPGIAQVFEAGTWSGDGVELPFIAMEYIPGARPITEYVREKHLGLRERLQLFRQVCDAVHHGHQKGIVHRDLKPGNILVDATGRVRVIDFGVARATDSDLAQTAHQTSAGTLVGSLPYMSPEQFEADPHNIDIRSDVYSLGVVLYEMLSGRHPHEFSATQVHEMARRVRETAPRRLGDIDATLKGEIETIVHKALERDRDLRYQSAFGLSEDLRRHLDGEAISARPQTFRYQVEIFARRNRGLIGAVAAIFLLLVGGIVTSTVLYVSGERARAEAAAARVRAEEQAARAEASLTFLQEMLTTALPRDYGHDPTVLDLLDRTSARLNQGVLDEPEVEGEMRQNLAMAYFHFMNTDRAADEAVLARTLYHRSLGPDHPRTVDMSGTALFLCQAVGREEDELEIARELRAIAVGEHGERSREAVDAGVDLAAALDKVGATSEAEELCAELVATSRDVFGEEDPATLDVLAYHSWLLLERGRDAEALALAEQCHAVAERTLESADPVLRAARSALAGIRIATGDFDGARALYATELPDIQAEDMFQGSYDPQRGGVRLLVFWEVWCPFSIRIVPELNRVFESERSAGLDMVAFTQMTRNATPQKVAGFIEEKRLSCAVAEDDGRLWKWFECTGTPAIVVVRDGHMLWERKVGTREPLPGRLVRSLMDAG